MPRATTEVTVLAILMQHDRRRGCFHGLAIWLCTRSGGRVLGASSFEPLIEYGQEGPHGLEPGENDDTRYSDRFGPPHWLRGRGLK